MNATSDRLRQAVLETLIDRVENGEEVKNPDGGAERIPCSPNVINSAIAFLKVFPPDAIGVGAELTTQLQSLSGKLGELRQRKK